MEIDRGLLALGSPLGRLWARRSLGSPSERLPVTIGSHDSTSRETVRTYIAGGNVTAYFEYMYCLDFVFGPREITVTAIYGDQDPLVHNCGACGTTGAIHRCTGCENIYYCSAACRRADWRRHRYYCKIMDMIIRYCIVDARSPELCLLKQIVHRKLQRVYHGDFARIKLRGERKGEKLSAEMKTWLAREANRIRRAR